jgi:hypothetical protein
MAGAGYQVSKLFSIPAAAVNPINGPTVTQLGTGGTVPAGTYYVKYTWVTATGETIPCAQEPTVTTTGSTSTITVSLPGLPNSPVTITGANVYIGITVAGTESFQGYAAIGSSFVLTTPITQGKPLPSYNTTSYTDITTSALGLPDGSEFIIHNLFYNSGVAFGVADGTNVVVFDGDTSTGARTGLALHCSTAKWLRVFNTSPITSLQAGVGGIQTV